jgi:hypothetical protein
MPAFAAATPEQIAGARRLYAEGSDCDIEIDGNAMCSPTETGTWVQAWVRLPNQPKGETT